MASVAMSTAKDKRGEAMGQAMAGVALGVVSGPSLGGVASQFLGPAFPFFLIFGLILFVMATHARVQLRYPQPFGETSSSTTDALSDSETSGASAMECTQNSVLLCGVMPSLMCDEYVLMLGLAAIVSNGMIAVMEPLTPLFMVEDFGIRKASDIGLIFGVLTLGYLVGTPIAGAMADRGPKWAMVTAGIAIQGIAMVLYMQCTVMWQVYCCLACIGLCMAFVDVPILPLLTEIADARDLGAYGSVMAVADLCTSLGFVLGPTVVAVMGNVSAHLLTVPIGAAAILLALPVGITLRKGQSLAYRPSASCHRSDENDSQAQDNGDTHPPPEPMALSANTQAASSSGPGSYIPQCTAWIGSIPVSCDEQRLRECLGKYGTITLVTLRRKPAPKTSWSFVTFATPAQLQNVLKVANEDPGHIVDSQRLVCELVDDDKGSTAGGMSNAIARTHVTRRRKQHVLELLRCGANFYGNQIAWLGLWTVADVDAQMFHGLPAGTSRDIRYVLLGLLVLMLTDVFYSSAGLPGKLFHDQDGRLMGIFAPFASNTVGSTIMKVLSDIISVVASVVLFVGGFGLIHDAKLAVAVESLWFCGLCMLVAPALMAGTKTLFVDSGAHVHACQGGSSTPAWGCERGRARTNSTAFVKAILVYVAQFLLMYGGFTLALGHCFANKDCTNTAENVWKSLFFCSFGLLIVVSQESFVPQADEVARVGWGPSMFWLHIRACVALYGAMLHNVGVWLFLDMVINPAWAGCSLDAKLRGDTALSCTSRNFLYIGLGFLLQIDIWLVPFCHTCGNSSLRREGSLSTAEETNDRVVRELRSAAQQRARGLGPMSLPVLEHSKRREQMLRKVSKQLRDSVARAKLTTSASP